MSKLNDTFLCSKTTFARAIVQVMVVRAAVYVCIVITSSIYLHILSERNRRGSTCVEEETRRECGRDWIT